MQVALGRLQVSLVVVKRERGDRVSAPTTPAPNPLERVARRNRALEQAGADQARWLQSWSLRLDPGAVPRPGSTLPDAPYWDRPRPPL